MSKASIDAVTKLVLVAELIGDLEQLARHSPEKVKQLAGDIAVNGLHHAIGIAAGKRIIYGHGRYLAVKSLGWKEIEAKLYPDGLSETQVRVIRATENLLRTDLTGWEKFQLCQELLRLNPSWKGIDLADHLHIDPGMVTRLTAPGRCIPAVLDGLKGGLLTIEDCYKVYRLSEAEQHEYLAARRAGESAAAVVRRVRAAANGASEAPKTNRIKILLSNGLTVTFQAKGREISLADAIDAAPEAARLMKRGQDQGLTARTIQKVSAERARKVVATHE